jgi:hypothetical protein
MNKLVIFLAFHPGQCTHRPEHNNFSQMLLEYWQQKGDGQ